MSDRSRQRNKLGATGRQLNFSGWVPRPSNRTSDASSLPSSNGNSPRPLAGEGLGVKAGRVGERHVRPRMSPDDCRELNVAVSRGDAFQLLRPMALPRWKPCYRMAWLAGYLKHGLEQREEESREAQARRRRKRTARRAAAIA